MPWIGRIEELLMKRFPVVRAFALFLGLTLGLAAKQPNVIIVFTDDQGYGDLSCHGNPILKTPNLDRFHSQSVRFTDFHVASVCTPSRGELMTGLYALRNKAGMVPAGRNLMRRDLATMPQVFGDSGYATGLFGKWHLGDTYPHRPMDRGFQRVVWHKGWGLASEVEFDNSYYRTRYYDEMELKQSEKFCANLWFDEAMEWMDARVEREEPFFSYIALNTPHSPFDPLPEDYALYKDKVGDEKAEKFFALIHNIDWNFGRLDRWLDDRGIREDTIVVYMNDNGSSAGTAVFNAGMRGRKGSEYEGGHRGICFVRWPNGGFDGPRDIGAATHLTDILPTFIDLCGLNPPADGSFDGASLKPLLLDGKATLDDRILIVQYGGRNRPAKYQQSAVLWNRWRLVNGAELYDIESDPEQARDIASQYPEIARTLKHSYEAYWAEIADSIDEVEPLLVGHGKEPYTDLTSVSWIEVDCDNRNTVANAVRADRGGDWQIEADRGGTYRVQLSRWPFFMNRALSLQGPATAIGGEALNLGIALPIASAGLELDGGTTMRARPNRDGSLIEFTVKIEKGKHRLYGWFENEAGQRVSGAFYGRVSFVGP